MHIRKYQYLHLDFFQLILCYYLISFCTRQMWERDAWNIFFVLSEWNFVQVVYPWHAIFFLMDNTIHEHAKSTIYAIYEYEYYLYIAICMWYVQIFEVAALTFTVMSIILADWHMNDNIFPWWKWFTRRFTSIYGLFVISYHCLLKFTFACAWNWNVFHLR